MNATDEAQVVPEQKKDHTVETIAVIGGVLLIILVICLLARGGKTAAVGLAEVMAQLEG